MSDQQINIKGWTAADIFCQVSEWANGEEVVWVDDPEDAIAVVISFGGWPPRSGSMFLRIPESESPPSSTSQPAQANTPTRTTTPQPPAAAQTSFSEQRLLRPLPWLRDGNGPAATTTGDSGCSASASVSASKSAPAADDARSSATSSATAVAAEDPTATPSSTLFSSPAPAEGEAQAQSRPASASAPASSSDRRSDRGGKWYTVTSEIFLLGDPHFALHTGSPRKYFIGIVPRALRAEVDARRAAELARMRERRERRGGWELAGVVAEARARAERRRRAWAEWQAEMERVREESRRAREREARRRAWESEMEEWERKRERWERERERWERERWEWESRRRGMAEWERWERWEK